MLLTKPFYQRCLFWRNRMQRSDRIVKANRRKQMWTPVKLNISALHLNAKREHSPETPMPLSQQSTHSYGCPSDPVTASALLSSGETESEEASREQLYCFKMLLCKAKAMLCDWQRPNAFTCCRKYRVTNRRQNWRQSRLAKSCWRIIGFQKMHFDGWHL
jgi:hypothetical protein